MTIEDFIIWLVIGGIAGWLAGLKSHQKFTHKL
jgi:uncharacterized membrane protein YeaQ/YmgE (transglycosylase-associated protein family)